MIDVLAISPHPDDAELYCGGYLAKAVSQGYRVGILDLTQGERGSRGTIEDRKRELKAASKILGISHRENAKFPDGGIGSSRQKELEAIVKVIRKIKPTLILAPYWEERHPDHVHASRLVSEAIFFSGLKNFPKKNSNNHHAVASILYYLIRIEVEPTIYVDVSSVYSKKIDAIHAYSSQVKTQSKGHKTLLSDPLTLRSLEARDMYFGARIGVKYAEGFISRAHIGIDDPIKTLCTPERRSIQFFK